VGGARQVAEHHPEAVVEGHGDADPVVGGVGAGLADEVAVVEDVVVREGGALGEPGGAARVLDVDRVVEGELALAPSEVVVADAVGRGQQVLPLAGAEVDDLLERRQLGADLVEHGPVVAGLEARRREHRPAAGLPQGVGHLGGAVRRVQVHQDHPDLGGGVLDEHPLGAVRAPDAEAVALLQAHGQQRPGDALDLHDQLGVGQPDVLERDDQRLPVAVPGGGGRQVLADRLAEQRHGRRPRRVGDLAHGRFPLVVLSPPFPLRARARSSVPR
jgi:hypothetical protein